MSYNEQFLNWFQMIKISWKCGRNLIAPVIMTNHRSKYWIYITEFRPISLPKSIKFSRNFDQFSWKNRSNFLRILNYFNQNFVDYQNIITHYNEYYNMNSIWNLHGFGLFLDPLGLPFFLFIGLELPELAKSTWI